VLNGCILSVVWVPEGINNEMRGAALFKREAGVFNDHQVFEQAIGIQNWFPPSVDERLKVWYRGP